jgi:hypothetical protein
MTTPNKPTPADILVAIGKAQAGNWIDPSEVPVNWSCKLYNPEGRYVVDGNALIAREAMAFAWLNCWAPDALSMNGEGLDEVPFEIPEGWRFELTPPSFETTQHGDQRDD